MYEHGDEAFYFLFSNHVQYDESIFLSSFILFIVSRSFIEIINQYLIQMPFDLIDQHPVTIQNENELALLDNPTWSSIIVKDQLFNQLNQEITWNQLSFVQYICIQEKSFGIIRSLTIAHLHQLRLLVIDSDSFKEATVFQLEGYSSFYSLLIDLPNLQDLRTGWHSLDKVRHFCLKSIL